MWDKVHVMVLVPACVTRLWAAAGCMARQSGGLHSAFAHMQLLPRPLPGACRAQEQMAALEGGDRAFAFTSGMAAIAAVCRLVSAGEHIVAGEDIYGGTSRLLSQVVPSAGVSVTNVDMTDLE